MSVLGGKLFSSQMMLAIGRNHHRHFRCHHTPWDREKYVYMAIVAYRIEGLMHLLLRIVIYSFVLSDKVNMGQPTEEAGSHIERRRIG